jgi:hypothetical protein
MTPPPGARGLDLRVVGERELYGGIAARHAQRLALGIHDRLDPPLQWLR